MSTVDVPRRKLAVAAVLLSVLMLAGCGGHATGVLVPVAESAPGASVTDLLVITTRKPSGDPATLYGGDRDRNFSLDEIKVSIPPASQRKAGEVAWPRRLPPNPAKDFATVAVNRLEPNRQAGFAWLHENLPKS